MLMQGFIHGVIQMLYTLYTQGYTHNGLKQRFCDGLTVDNRHEKLYGGLRGGDVSLYNAR